MQYFILSLKLLNSINFRLGVFRLFFVKMSEEVVTETMVRFFEIYLINKDNNIHWSLVKNSVKSLENTPPIPSIFTTLTIRNGLFIKL